jgi:hypothetical protein
MMVESRVVEMAASKVVLTADLKVELRVVMWV